MENLLRQLGDQARGVWELIGLLFALMATVTWCFWVLGRGRFSRPRPTDDRSTIAYYIGTFVGQIITEFRHFLALMVVMLFAVTMATVIFLGRHHFEDVKTGVQVVAASLGG
jgi:hypothetical protein